MVNNQMELYFMIKFERNDLNEFIHDALGKSKLKNKGLKVN